MEDALRDRVDKFETKVGPDRDMMMIMVMIMMMIIAMIMMMIMVMMMMTMMIKNVIWP